MKLLNFLIIVLCLAGVLVASLALREHYNSDPSPCSINDKWDCGTVNHSQYAIFRNIPVAMIGILGYTFLAVLAGRFPRLTAGAALIGLIFSLRLTWIEWKVLGVWCIYCVGSHGIITTIFLLSALSAVLSSRRR
jgi:vitamin-K-epoxide reductase (warfarin-sensitive)